VAVTLSAAVVALAYWAFAVRHSPDLSSIQAGMIISSRPEFNQHATLVAVLGTVRDADSLADCCYTADFTFRQIGSTKLVHGTAAFRYWQGGCHLQEYWYQEPPSVQTVWIESDVPSDSQ